MKDLGIKVLDESNWLMQDKALTGFHRILPDSSTRTLTISEWFEELQKTKLEDYIPDEIHKLFEVARGTMTYGYFFYPIFTFSSEQFTRIGETAINHKCTTLSLPRSKNTFRKKVDWLFQESFITDDKYNKWKTTVDLRNNFSHPSKQYIFTPFMAIGIMNDVATNINQLYKSSG